MLNREQLIAYLLHQMPDEERAAIAEQWANDPELHKDLRTAEAELLDSYARGELDTWQRSRVEACLLTTEEQRRKLEFAQGLAAVINQGRRRAPSWIVIAASIGVLALLAASIWLARENGRLRATIAGMQRSARPIPGNFLAAAVPPGIVRGVAHQNEVKILPGINMLRLDLELEDRGNEQAYSVVVSAAGLNVWSESPIPPELRGLAWVVPVWIPAGVLVPGVYSASLETRGGRVQVYQFTIVR
jgi:hypothetical protein